MHSLTCGLLRALAVCSMVLTSSCATLNVMGHFEKDSPVRQGPQDANLISGIQAGITLIPTEWAVDLLSDNFTAWACSGTFRLNIKAFHIQSPRLYIANRLVDFYGQAVVGSNPPKMIYVRGEFQLAGGLLTLYKSRVPSLRELQKEYVDGPTERDFQSVASNNGKMADLARTYGRTIPLQYDTPNPEPDLFISVARDPASNAWSGFIGGKDVPCGSNTISMTNDSGLNTGWLPKPISPQFAKSFGITTTWTPDSAVRLDSRIFWARQYQSAGYYEAEYFIAKALEKRAEVVGSGYELAFKSHYDLASEKKDSRSQLALSQFYKSGNGVQADQSESRRWRELAEAQFRTAGSICSSSIVRTETLALIEKEKSDPGLAMVRLIGGALGLSVTVGNSHVLSVVFSNYVAPSQPFECTVSVITPSRFTNYSPSFEYAGKDSSGQSVYIDRRLEKMLKDRTIEFSDERSRTPYERSLKVDSVSNNRYVLTLLPNLRDISRIYSTRVELKPQ